MEIFGTIRVLYQFSSTNLDIYLDLEILIQEGVNQIPADQQKVYHEGLPLKDCFFPNYKFEEKPAGCIPKWPLIFEIRQGYEVLAIRILNQDPNIDVNQQDALGNTALHYGVMGEHQKFIESLLEHGGVIMNRRNKAGKTPLSLAREIGNEEIITAIEEHKDRLRLAVDPQDKLATTWASLKER